MPRRIGQPTGGVVAVQQDDGTVVTLPESLAPAPDPVTQPVDKTGQALPVDAAPIGGDLGSQRRSGVRQGDEDHDDAAAHRGSWLHIR